MDENQGRLYKRDMIGSRIRLGRTNKKLPLRIVGEAMGVTPQAVAQWEKTNPKLDIDKTHKLANLLDVDVDWLRGKTGTDGEVLSSGLSSKFEGRVPLIPKEHVVLFGLFNRNNTRGFDYEETIEPSTKLVGQGFAVRLQADDELPPLQAGDILIFDNGRTPKDGDFVAAITVDDFVRTIFVICVYEEEPEEGQSGTLTLVAPPDTEASRLIEANGGATPIGVMSEYRAFRRPPSLPSKPSKI